MPDALADLQTFANVRRLFTHGRAERPGNLVQILLQTGLNHGQRPLLCKTVEFPPANPREAIDALAIQALGYWRAVLATGRR